MTGNKKLLKIEDSKGDVICNFLTWGLFYFWLFQSFVFVCFFKVYLLESRITERGEKTEKRVRDLAFAGLLPKRLQPSRCARLLPGLPWVLRDPST